MKRVKKIKVVEGVIEKTLSVPELSFVLCVCCMSLCDFFQKDRFIKRFRFASSDVHLEAALASDDMELFIIYQRKKFVLLF